MLEDEIEKKNYQLKKTRVKLVKWIMRLSQQRIKQNTINYEA